MSNERETPEIAVRCCSDGKIQIVILEGETGEGTGANDSGRIEEALGR